MLEFPDLPQLDDAGRITEILLTFWIIETVVIAANSLISSALRTAACSAWQACTTASNLSGSPSDLGVLITL
jgi:hypothetical protein